MNEGTELEKLILDYVNRPNYQPVKPRVIFKKLGLAPELKVELRRTIKRLARRGALRWGERHIVFAMRHEEPPPDPPAAAREPEAAAEAAARQKRPKREPVPPAEEGKSIVTGVFRTTSKGFGFVRPVGVTRQAGRSEDIFVPANGTLDAADGDLVAVRLSRQKLPAKPESPDEPAKKRGRIVEVLERDTHQFVGVYFERGGLGFVQVDGDVFKAPILVGDAGAKGAGSGDKVVIEMVRFPSHQFEGEGVVIEVLGPRGAPGVDTLSIIREYNLPTEFPAAVLESAREQAEAFDESLDGRLDLTGECIITIDPRDARDFDDAISLTQIENGHWRLGVHIADVSHFVPVGTPLDDEARDRATSVYLPDRVLPMLPEIISNNLASLQPDRVRYAKTAFIEFTPAGQRVGAEVHTSAIKSRRRFTYEEVDEYLADREAWQEKLAEDVHSLLGRMHELAMILRRRRLDGGAIELHLPEVKIDLDERGRVSGAHVVENTESHQVIEEFMLAANEAVAEHLADRGIAFLRRVHEPPLRRKLQALTAFVRELGIECDSLESRFEIKRVLEQTADRPERHAVHFAVLRSMQKAVYSPDEQGHYALASDNYCHFTSPIRRYPDLTVHRLLERLSAGKRSAPGAHLELLGQHCSEREQRAEAAERELVKVKLLTYLKDRIGEEMDGVITGVEQFGLFVQGTGLPAEGLVHVTSLSDDYYLFEPKSHTLQGRRAGNQFRLGDLVRVEIAHVDVDRRELDFRLVKRGEKPKKGKRGKKDKKRKGKTLK